MDAREFRETGHRVVDLMADYLDGVEERPLFPEVDPAHLEALFDEPIPRQPAPAEDVLREIEEPLFKAVLDYAAGNQSAAAGILGMNRGTLRKKLKKYGMN